MANLPQSSNPRFKAAAVDHPWKELKPSLTPVQLRCMLALRDERDRWTTAHDIGENWLVLETLRKRNLVERQMVPAHEPAAKWNKWQYRICGMTKAVTAQDHLLHYVHGWKAGAAALGVTPEQMKREGFAAGWEAGNAARLAAYDTGVQKYGVTLSPLRSKP